MCVNRVIVPSVSIRQLVLIYAHIYIYIFVIYIYIYIFVTAARIHAKESRDAAGCPDALKYRCMRVLFLEFEEVSQSDLLCDLSTTIIIVFSTPHLHCKLTIQLLIKKTTYSMTVTN